VKTNKLFAILMIVLGAFLEVYFYVFRFTQDGISLTVAITIASALNLLMALGVYRCKSNLRWLFLVAPLGLYSVFSTSAGQTFSLLTKENNIGIAEQTKQENTSGDEITRTLNRLSTEAANITDALNKLPADPLERAKWRTFIKQSTDRLTSIDAQAKDLRNERLLGNTDTLSATKKATLASDIYSFYSNLPTWNSTEWLKFLFHSILSAFIAIMTPLGVLSWPNNDGKNKGTEKLSAVIPAKQEPIKEFTLTEEIAKTFVHYSWYCIRNKTSNKIINKQSLYKMLALKGVALTEDTYAELIKKSLSLGLFNSKGEIIIEDEAKAIKKLLGV
jgi:hypothetical protein